MPQRRLPCSRVWLQEALAQLGQDKWLAPLIAKLPHPQAAAKKDPFHALIVAILNQQISLKAAAAIGERLTQLVGRPYTPAAIATASPSAMRAAGMSATKIACAKAFAQDGWASKLTARSCRNMSDELIYERIIAFKGAGPWTAQMVLIFGLGRADVMPAGDGGIQRAAAKLFTVQDIAAAQNKLREIAPTWKPYRTLGAWFLWRSLAD